jgi:hypothetical protein
MAPEHALPGMDEVDERSDVWSAGATLFALLSGRTVHEGDTTEEVMLRTTVDSARSLALAAPAAPRAIVEVVDGALAFEKSARWQSARAMRVALLAAYRLHFGRAPSRETLARLVRGPARRTEASARRLELAATDAALPSRKVAEGSTRRSRTSSSAPCTATPAPPTMRRARSPMRVASIAVACVAIALVAALSRQGWRAADDAPDARVRAATASGGGAMSGDGAAVTDSSLVDGADGAE